MAASSGLSGTGYQESGNITGTWLKMTNHRKDIIDIGAGSLYSLASMYMLTSTGDIYSTGNNGSGQLGNGVFGNEYNSVYKMIL